VGERTIDVTGDHCPLTYVKTKIALAGLGKGDRLAVLLRDGEPLENVPRAAEGEGHRILGIEHVGPGVCRVVIEKN